jgi:hypothetical protein
MLHIILHLKKVWCWEMLKIVALEPPNLNFLLGVYFPTGAIQTDVRVSSHSHTLAVCEQLIIKRSRALSKKQPTLCFSLRQLSAHFPARKSPFCALQYIRSVACAQRLATLRQHSTNERRGASGATSRGANYGANYSFRQPFRAVRPCRNFNVSVDEKTNNLWEREETDSGEGETWLKIQRVDHSLNS